MPEYTFICDDCGSRETTHASMSNAPKPGKCSACGGKQYQDYGVPMILGASSGKSILSQSMAVSPQQVSEHRDKFPDVGVHSDGVLEFKSQKQKDNYMEKTGFYQPPSKLKK